MKKASKPLNFAMPSDRPNTVLMKNEKGEALFELRSLPGNRLEVRALPRADSTMLAVVPNASNSVTIVAADVEPGHGV